MLTDYSLVFQQFSDQHPESASGIKLTMAQLYLIQGTDMFLYWLWFDVFSLSYFFSFRTGYQLKMFVWVSSDFKFDLL